MFVELKTYCGIKYKNVRKTKQIFLFTQLDIVNTQKFRQHHPLVQDDQ